MSISTVLNKWLKRTYKLLAISLVLFACFISILRLFLPYAHHYRAHIEAYINSTYNIDITIGSLDMDWEKSGPTLTVKQLELLSSDGIKIIVNNLDVELNFWRSLQARKFVTENFIISQTVLELKEESLRDAESNAEKIVEQSNKNNILIDRLSSILLEQVSRFSIVNSHVLYHTSDGVRAFTINEMFWVNTGNVHRADGTVILDGISSNNLKLLLNFQGKKFDTFTGQAYLEAHDINITPWLGRVLAIDDVNTHSSINFNTWINVKAGKAEQIQFAFGNNEISWQHNNSEQTFEVDGGNIEIQRLDALVYNLSSTPITIKRNNIETNRISILAKVNSKHIDGYVDGIDLTSFNGVFPLLFDDENIENLLIGLAPTGRIEDIHFLASGSDLAITANFKDIDNQYSQGIPGIDNASGELIYQNKKLHISLNANDGALDFDKHFKLPIQYTHLSTDIDIDFLDNNWQLSATNIAVKSPEISLTGNVKVLHEQDKPLTMSLLASVSDGNAKYAEHYYPLIMGESLYNYLDGAVVDGTLPQATVLFNGPLKSFPFQNNEGIFVVDAELSDATFVFDPKWPAIKNFAANLNFTNNSMYITAREGTLSGVDVTGVKADIEDLADEQLLNVLANFENIEPKLVTALMNESPMQSSIGSVLEQVIVQGPIKGDFSLVLPLNSPEAVIAKGRIDFQDNKVLLQSPAMDFTKVNGHLYYHNDVITASDVNLNWRGMPVTLNALAKQKNDNYHVNIETLGQWQEAQWQVQVPNELVKYAQGLLTWQGQLALNINDDKLTYDYQASANLNDNTLAIPEPFNKVAGEELTATVHAFGDKKRSIIDGEIGKTINFNSILEHHDTHFSLANVVLGKKQLWQPSTGFHITADLENADYEQWQPLILDIIASVKKSSSEAESTSFSEETTSPLLSVPNSINSQVKNLMAYGQTFHDVNINVIPEQEGWLLNIDAKEAKGKAKFYPDWHNQGIDINLNFLHLTAIENDENEADTLKITKEINITHHDAVKNDQKITAVKIKRNPEEQSLITPEEMDDFLVQHKINKLENAKIFANVPAMKVHCDSCKYGLYDYGEVSFNLERKDEKTLLLKQFIAQRDDNRLEFDAQWQLQSGKSVTHVKGLFNTENVEREVENVGYVSTIKDSGVAMNFDLHWQGGPHDYSPRTLGGDLDTIFDDGYLADVDDNGVRIFSLLSLQSLVRKLSFDFRDVFSDGMFYSELKGSFNVQDGIAYTDNVFMKGSAGDLAIIGNTNLNTNALDYRMTYKPNLTSSLPVLAWIATLNPVTFIAGMALDEVITSLVISEINFEVTGNLDKPIFKQVSKKTKNISVGRSTPPTIVDNIVDDSTQSNSPLPEKKLSTPAKDND